MKVLGTFWNRGNFVKFAKRMYPAPVSRHESKPTRDAPCARTATRRVITILTLWKEPRIYWFSMYVTKGNIGFRTYSNPGNRLLGRDGITASWVHGKLGSWQLRFISCRIPCELGSFHAGFMASWVLPPTNAVLIWKY